MHEVKHSGRIAYATSQTFSRTWAPCLAYGACRSRNLFVVALQADSFIGFGVEELKSRLNGAYIHADIPLCDELMC